MRQISKKQMRKNKLWAIEKRFERLAREGNRIHRCENPNSIYGGKSKDHFFKPDCAILEDLKKFREQNKIIIYPTRI